MYTNYPEGVTGNEWQIAGASAEFDETREVQCGNDDCAKFEELVEVGVYTRAYDDGVRVFEWTCPTCGKRDEDEYYYEHHTEYEPDMFMD